MSLWLDPLRNGGILQGFEVDNDVAFAYAPGVRGEYYKIMGFSAGYSGVAPSAGLKTVTFKRGMETVLVVRHDFANAGNIEAFSLPAALRSRTGESFTVELQAGGAAGCLGKVSVFATPQPGVSPLQLPGLVAWYDASQITGLSDGEAVAQWNDVSGNGNHLTQGTAGFRPIYKVSIVNGLPVVRFDGTDDKLTRSTLVAATTQVTAYFFVWKVDTTGGNQQRFIDYDGTGERQAVDVLIATSVIQLWASEFREHTSWSGDVNQLVTVVIDGSGDGSSSTIRIDGVALTPAAVDPGDFGLGSLRVGSAADGTIPLKGDLAELAIFGAKSSPYSTTEITQMESYLASKWGIGI